MIELHTTHVMVPGTVVAAAAGFVFFLARKKEIPTTLHHDDRLALLQREKADLEAQLRHLKRCCWLGWKLNAAFKQLFGANAKQKLVDIVEWQTERYVKRNNILKRLKFIDKAQSELLRKEYSDKLAQLKPLKVKFHALLAKEMELLSPEENRQIVTISVEMEKLGDRLHDITATEAKLEAQFREGQYGAEVEDHADTRCPSQNENDVSAASFSVSLTPRRNPEARSVPPKSRSPETSAVGTHNWDDLSSLSSWDEEAELADDFDDFIGDDRMKRASIFCHHTV